MKLKYLLPAATIASVAAVVTPLVTSCGNGNTASWTKGKEYKPLEPKAAHEFNNIKELISGYHDDVEAKKFIYSDDLVNFFYKLTTIEKYKDDFQFRSVKVTTQEIGPVKTIQTSNPAVLPSYFTVTLSISIDATIKNGENTLEFKNRKGTLTNVPVTLFKSKFDSKSSIATGLILNWESMSCWTLDIPEIKIDPTTYAVSIGDQNKTYDYKYLAQHQEAASVFEMLIPYMCTFEMSNYYSNQTVAE